MSSGARYYSTQTIKKLFGLSGNQCAFSECTRTLVNQSNAVDSNICHIEAAHEGGERYNPQMSNAQRADYENLILLCPQHHVETNDVDTYTVESLKKMKSEHESSYLNMQLKNRPSMLSNVITAIAAIQLEEEVQSETLSVFSIQEKLDFNHVRNNRSVFQEYKVYHAKLNTLYDELEMQGSMRKERLLHNIHLIYLKVKGSYVQDRQNSMSIIREHADRIIDDVYDALYLELESSPHFNEDIMLGLHLIIVDAFIRCKILEEPK